VPSIWHRLRKRGHGGIVRTRAVDDRGQRARRDERKWREEANVPFHLAFTLRDLGERLNAARKDIAGPRALMSDFEREGLGGEPRDCILVHGPSYSFQN
jgi:hypothetical protein